jgi:hypothetical protein
MNMMKALIPSTILTLIISALVGRVGPEGSFLNLQGAAIGGYVLYWSWTLFFVAMALNGALVLQMARGEGPAEPQDPVGGETAEGKA